MKISFREETTIDYPGKFGVIVFTSGCNFKCGFCHNYELIDGVDNEIDLDFLLKDLEVKAQEGWYKAVTISGGEPCLQNGLIEFVKKLKELGLSVKIDTNGSRPDVLRELSDVGVDYVAMDIKSPKGKYNEITGVEVDIEKIEESIRLVEQFPNSEFRTTVLPFYSKSDIEEMGKWVKGIVGSKVKLWTLQQFLPEKTRDVEYREMSPSSKEKLDKFGELMKEYADEIRVLV